jgi:thiamine monophosphate synthase
MVTSRQALDGRIGEAGVAVVSGLWTNDEPERAGRLRSEPAALVDGIA